MCSGNADFSFIFFILVPMRFIQYKYRPITLYIMRNHITLLLPVQDSHSDSVSLLMYVKYFPQFPVSALTADIKQFMLRLESWWPISIINIRTLTFQQWPENNWFADHVYRIQYSVYCIRIQYGFIHVGPLAGVRCR